MIDTAEKLRSAAGVGFFVLGPGVTPNAAKDREWRQQAGWGYSGIELASLVLGPYLIAAASIMQAGNRAGEAYAAGSLQGQAYTAGSQTGQAYSPGATQGQTTTAGVVKGESS